MPQTPPAAFAFALFIRASSVYDGFEVWTKDTLVHAYRRGVETSEEIINSACRDLTPRDNDRQRLAWK